MRPTERQLKLLSKKELKIFNLTYKFHNKYRQFTIKWQNKTGRFFTRLFIGKRIRYHDLENIDCIKSNSKVIIIANHRSYFDFWPPITAIMKRCSAAIYYFFPVRSSFFYDRLLGFWTNFFISSASMFPPIMRDKEKLKFNQYALQYIDNELNKSNQGTVIGLHPEGKRNRHEDPHQLLPGKQGIGKIITQAPESTIVIPVFIHGLSNSPWQELKKNYKRKIDTPIDVLFGTPLQFDKHKEDLPDACKISSITQQCMDAIQALANKHKDINGSAFKKTQHYTTH